MLRINIFSYVFWPEQFLLNEMVEDMAQSNEICVLTGLPNYPRGDFFEGYSLGQGPYRQNYKGAQVFRYPVMARKKGFFKLMINYGSHLVSALLVQFQLPKARWAFVFATSPITTAIPAIIWAKQNRAKVCIWLQDLWPDSVAAVGATNRNSLLYKLLGLVVRWIYKRTDLILIQSPGFADNLKEFGYKGPVYVVPNWAPGLDFENVKAPTWLPESRNQFIVTFAGNVGKAQAIDTVIKAAEIIKQNKEILFYIVGDGSELERVQKLAQEQKLENVLFFGRRALTDMPGLFKNSSALLVTLSRDPIFARTIPSKVQAYMAAGKPLIGSLDGVGAEVIREAQCGDSVPAEDPQGLAQSILEMSKRPPEQWLKLGANAQSYFYANYRKDTIIGQISSYLEKHQ